MLLDGGGLAAARPTDDDGAGDDGEGGEGGAGVMVPVTLAARRRFEAAKRELASLPPSPTLPRLASGGGEGEAGVDATRAPRATIDAWAAGAAAGGVAAVASASAERLPSSSAGAPVSSGVAVGGSVAGSDATAGPMAAVLALMEQVASHLAAGAADGSAGAAPQRVLPSESSSEMASSAIAASAALTRRAERRSSQGGEVGRRTRTSAPSDMPPLLRSASLPLLLCFFALRCLSSCAPVPCAASPLKGGS